MGIGGKDGEGKGALKYEAKEGIVRSGWSICT